MGVFDQFLKPSWAYEPITQEQYEKLQKEEGIKFAKRQLKCNIEKLDNGFIQINGGEIFKKSEITSISLRENLEITQIDSEGRDTGGHWRADLLDIYCGSNRVCTIEYEPFKGRNKKKEIFNLIMGNS